MCNVFKEFLFCDIFKMFRALTMFEVSEMCKKNAEIVYGFVTCEVVLIVVNLFCFLIER